MKKFLNVVKHTPVLLMLIVILLCFFPHAIIAPPESVDNSIITAVGIDKKEDEFEVSLLTFLSYPNQTYTESYEVFTSTGKTLSEALTKAGLQVGKNISLFHVHTTVISEKLLEEDIAPALDFLVRVASLPQSCVLVATNVDSKTFLDFITELDSQTEINLEELSFYNSNYIYWNDTTISAFMKGYYSPTRSSMLSFFPLSKGDIDGIPVEDPSAGGSSGGGEGGSDGGMLGGALGGGGGAGGQGGGAQTSGGAAQGSGDPKKVELINDGSEIIVKDGKIAAIIDRDTLRGLNWFNSKTEGTTLALDQVSDENFTNASLIYRINAKQVLDNVEYENGYPVYSVDLRLFVSLVEVNGSKDDRAKKHEPSYISEKVREKMEEEIKKQINSSLMLLTEKKCDVLEIYEKFYRSKRAETKKFVREIGDPDEFLSHIVFKFTVSVFPN